MKNIIFLISLPRSGSTLLQRILASHSLIESHAEPWILLPLIYGLKRKDGIRAIYAQKAAHQFIKEFNLSLKKDMNYYIRDFVFNIYSDILEGDQYFLDKTPRYHLIIDELIEIFPKAKYIFLFRNPLSVIASILTTSFMCNNNLCNLDKYLVDLEFGFNNMIKGYFQYRDKILAVKYEDLIANPISSLKDISTFIGIDFEENMITSWKHIDLKGSAGDKEGIYKYRTISAESKEKYKKVFKNPIRRNIAKKILSKIDREFWEILEYDQNEINKIQGFFNPLEFLKDLYCLPIANLKYFLRKKIMYI